MSFKHIKAYAYMSIIKPSKLLNALHALNCLNEDAGTSAITYTMYIYAFSRAGLSAVLKQQLEVTDVNAILQQTDAYHFDMLSLFFSKSGIDQAEVQEMLSTARDMIADISASIEHRLTETGAAAAAEPALRRLLKLMDIENCEFSADETAKLAQAMRAILDYTVDDCREMDLL